MTLCRHRVTALWATAALVGAVVAAVGLVHMPQAIAETGVGVVDRCDAPSDGSRMRIDVLVLLDISGSLRTNDPNDIRISGTKDAILVLDNLSGQFEGADIRLAVDSFHTNYLTGQDWIDARGASTALLPRIEQIGAIPDVPTTTDYTQAMTGAWSRFGQGQADCRLLVWFTDGDHSTSGSVEDVSPEEWAELNQLCDSLAMESLRSSAWVGAVRLVADGGNGETLNFLFGEGERSCANALQGEIHDDFDPANLGRVLHDIIAGATEDIIFRQDQAKLPGELDTPPASGEYETCTEGIGTREQPCVIPFQLDRSHESFRTFIDLTFIRQGIRNPELVQLVVRSPRDDVGTFYVSPTIGAAGDIDPAEAGGEYRLIPPFGFYSRAQYGSEIQIVGHQAAEQLTDSGQWKWQWEGEWALLFFGDTPEAQSDARRAAATVRFQTTDRPATDSFGVDANSTMSGFVAKYPLDYENIELRARLDAGDGEAVYATRRSLTDEPLEVVGNDRRFELPGFFDHLVAWDSEQGGGNGRNLHDAITQRGGLSAAAGLKQEFQYGAHPELLEWERDIGSWTLTPAQLEHLLRLLDGYGRAERLRAVLGDPNTVWLPSGLTMGEPQVSGDSVSVSVSVVPGRLAGVLTLEHDSLMVVGAAPITLAAVPTDGTGADTSTTTAPPRAADPWVESDPWGCDVPAASGDGGTFTCTNPLRLRAYVEQDTELSVALAVGVAEQQVAVDGLLEGLWFQPGSAGGDHLSGLLNAALGRERRSELLDTGRFALVVPPPQLPPPPPPPPIDKLREFWPLLAALLASAAAGRLFVAWRLRPWDPLDSADYVAIALSNDESLQHSPDPSDVQREICMDVRQRKTSTHIGGVKLRSRWLPLLLGSSPMILASSKSGDCIGPRGCRPRRSGLCTARIGADLGDGWTINITPGNEQLVVWDLPLDEREVQDRIDDSVRAAATRLRSHRESHKAAATADEAGERGAGDEMSSGSFVEQGDVDVDPFASDAGTEDDTDPFGRSS